MKDTWSFAKLFSHEERPTEGTATFEGTAYYTSKKPGMENLLHGRMQETRRNLCVKEEFALPIHPTMDLEKSRQPTLTKSQEP